jgi:hypothetical protein
MKQIILVLITALCLCAGNKALAQVVASGTTGECTWELTGTSDNYTLTISGNGAMEDYYYFYSNSYNTPWYSYRSNIKALVIQQGVTSIGDAAFIDCPVSSINIPNSVTSIGDAAFNMCSRLTSVTIPNSVTTIGEYAFSGCWSLTSVTIPNSVTTIGEYAFYDCNSLTGTLIIPNSVTTIGEYAFYDCSSLTGTLTIPNSVTNIGILAFRGCRSLTSVTIPNSITSIEYGVFSYCYDLTSVTIPNSVTTIEERAFLFCYNLTSVTIGNSVTTIEDGVFLGCSDLTEIYLKATTPPSVGTDAFDSVPTTIPIHVPCGSEAAYQNASGWRDFSNIIGDTYSSKDIISCSVVSSDTFIVGESYANSVFYGITADGEDVSFGDDNQFIVELSDSVGSFSSYKEIGRVNRSGQIFTDGVIPISIPRDVLPGAKYRIRVSSTNPLSLSNDEDITIVAYDAVPQVIAKVIPRQTDDAGLLTVHARVQSKYPITEIRYRIDSQNDVSITIPEEEATTDYHFKMTYEGANLSSGAHKFYMQFKNFEGQWSQLESGDFAKVNVETANITLTAGVIDSLVRLQWNSVPDVTDYKLKRDGNVIHTFTSESHPIDIRYVDYPGVGAHTYTVTGYNGLSYSGKMSPVTNITITASNPADKSTTQNGTVFGYIVDDNNVEIDGAVVTFSHNNRKISSQLGKYSYSGLPYGVKGTMNVEKENYVFRSATGSDQYEITSARPIAAVNWTGQRVAGDPQTATPQNYEIAVVSPLNKDLSDNKININADNYFSFEVKNLTDKDWSGVIILSLYKYVDETFISSHDIGRSNVSLQKGETKRIYIDVPHNTIDLYSQTYRMCLLSRAGTYRNESKKMILGESVTNPQEISLVGEKIRGLEYWEEQITTLMSTVKKGNSYANTYTKYTKGIDMVTGSHIQDMMLSEIIADISKYTGDALKLEKKAKEYIETIKILDEARDGDLTEANAFKLFCKVAGAGMKRIALEYPGPAYIYGQYFEVLEKARDKIIQMGNNIFDDYSLPFLMNEGAVCISVRVERAKYLSEILWNRYFTSSEVAGAISSAKLKAVRPSDNTSFGETPLNKCESKCCGKDDEEVYLTLQHPINIDLNAAVVYILTIEWTNGRISKVPLTRDFAQIRGDYNDGEIKIEFKSEHFYHIETQGNYISNGHMANKIHLKYYGD